MKLKNGHILPAGQWYTPSVVINNALTMQWIVLCRVHSIAQYIVECIVKCKVYCILHCIEQYIVYSSVVHSSKSCWNISQLMPKCSPCSFHVETTSPCGRRNLHVEHNLAMWKQLLHVENDFSIWKTTSPYGSVSAGREKWPFNVLFFFKSRASVWPNLMCPSSWKLYVDDFPFFWFLSSLSRTRARAVWSLGDQHATNHHHRQWHQLPNSQTLNSSSSGSRRAREEPKKGKSSKYNFQDDGHLSSGPAVHD